MVRRTGKADRRRCHPRPLPDKRIVCIKASRWVLSPPSPLELPQRHDRAQGRPALAAGCTIVIKPASETPLSAFAMAELAERAGVPAGVLNIVTGSSSAIGGELTANPLVRKLTFTGSTPVGKMLEAQCAATMKKTSMELGATRPSSYLTMPISMPPSRVR